MSIQIRVRYFAALREIVGSNEELLTVQPGTSIKQMRVLLLARYPRLEQVLARATSAVNRQYVSPETVLNENDEVVFIPPVGGGK
jgi:molybdopterin converting factor subunit 1